MRSSSFLPFSLLLILYPRPAVATQWHVDAAAAPGGNGSPQQPFNTLGQVVPVIATGDTVLVAAGTYSETVHFAQIQQGSGGPTVIKAAGGAAPVIDGGGSAEHVLKVTQTDKVTIEGLTLRNTTGSGVLFHEAHDGQVLSCKTESVGIGVTFYFSDRGLVKGCDLQGGVAGKATDGTVVRESKVHDSAGTGLYLHAGSKNCKYVANEIYDNLPDNIYIDSSSDMTVDRNLIYMTKAPPTDHAAIQLADEQYPNVTAPLLQNITITNNVMLGNGYGVMFWEGSFPGQSGLKNVRIANNTIVNSAAAALVWDPGPHSATIQNNILADDGKGTAAMLVMAKSTTG
ncbi:MAG: right-handed parallel beta-helix repeat-containing protein, partial [Deltaproteobacteria bacterium]|nr:right-handed parallel beta-helix repeat-containing protein [Deltaproteobacteria bacterium]